MVSLAVFVMLQVLRVSSYPEEPAIYYCVSNQKTSGDCTFLEGSKSAFKFGSYSQNVISLFQQKDQFLHLRCTASYPIRWLAQNPAGAVHYTLRPEFSLTTPEVLTYVQQLAIPLRSEFGGVFMCESFLDHGLIAELFINSTGRPLLNDSLLFAKSTLKYFEVDGNHFQRQTSGKLLLPCVAKYFHEKPTAKLLELSRKSEGLTLSPNCALCICIASSECSNNDFACISTNVCGFNPSMWQVGGVAPSREHDDRKSCTSKTECSTCAIEGIQEYFNHIHNKVRDCDGDGVLSCEDYALMYLLGNKDCHRRMSWRPQMFYDRFRSCLHKRKQTFKIHNTTREAFDPRIGFSLTLDANFESLFACSSLRSVQYLIPVSSHRRVKAEVYYGNKTGDKEGMHCDPESAVRHLQLQMGTCKSITDCDLKFTRIAPVIAVVQNSEEGKDQLLAYDEPAGIIPNETFGYVQCTARFFDTTLPNAIGYVDQADYVFKGFDDQMCMKTALDLYSKGFPNESIISVEKSDSQMKLNVLHTFDCKILTFVLLPVIYFEVQYSDSQLPLNYITLDENGIEVISTDDATKPVKAWRLYLNVTANMTRIICWAPWITSKNWASAELALDLTPETPERISVWKEDLEPTFNKYVIIGISTAGALVLASVLVIVVLCGKYLKSKAIIRKLTDEELDEFLKGNRSHSSDENNLVIESLGFSSDMVIPVDSLKISDELLGSGEFGVVHKGIFEEKSVAVKSCKPNADADYFKAFLKELKVMAFVGRHENVVVFYGAVIEEIQNCICYAVMELCPCDNLHNYLRKHCSSYSNRLSCPENVEESGAENIVVLNQSILVSFCKQIASGMDFVSAKKVIHADLATRNVLVFPNNVVKITDFGLSRKLYNCANYTRSKRVPLPWRWMALESLRFHQFSTKSDVWSFGVTIWEIFSFAQVPFSGLSWSGDFTERIESGLRLSKPQIASPEIYDMLQKCWENDPENRPTFTQCKAFFIHLEASTHRIDRIYGTVST